MTGVGLAGLGDTWVSRTGDRAGKFASSNVGGVGGWGVDMVGGMVGAKPRWRIGSEVVRNKMK